MTARRIPGSQPGGTARWVGGLLVTLCAVLAVLLHHELPDAPVAKMSAAAMQAMPGSPSDVHFHAGATGQGTSAHGGNACPSMGMEHCSAAGVTALQLAAPSHSPVQAVPAQHTAIALVHVAPATDRAPPDLSVLSQLRI
ncbi:DUF6153 family protein [Streptomyces sp. NPDC047043]|uniref:DUF6153 family protein n=1 Tax=Streptomyces sp. NPDC047043 TaxID=3154497 RepID=UPI0033CDCB5F